MKIQIIGHAREESLEVASDWSLLPILFSKKGNVVDHILKKDWKCIYIIISEYLIS